MSLAALCNICQSIPFLALRAPYSSELQELRKSDAASRTGTRRLAEPGTAKDGIPINLSKINIGSLEEISSRSKSCDLCAVILDAVGGQGASYGESKSLWDENIVFRADPDTSYYAYVVDSESGSLQNSSFVLRRLCITAHPKDDIDATLAYFNHILQPCHFRHDQTSVKEQVGQSQSMHPFQRELFSGRMRPLVVELHLLRSWLIQCEDKHSTRCSLPSKHLTPSYIRLIDISRQAVVQFQRVDLASLRYCTLSYVWGRSQPLVLSKATIGQLQSDGALATADLPLTIKDALYLTELLGLNYIWVDALCIVQDDIEDQQVQIGLMSEIYGFGTLNIVAAAGRDCNAGLPGLKPGTRTAEQRELVVRLPDQQNAGLSLFTTLGSHIQTLGEFSTRDSDDFSDSVWNQRGWTLQEMALSTRNLIFTGEQVLWSCGSAYYCEETRYEDWEDLPSSGLTRLRMRHFGGGIHRLYALLSAYEEHRTNFLSANDTKWYRLTLLVDMFTARNFTYSGDVFDGCFAIFNVLGARIEEDFHWGLPRSRFELALSWDTDHGLRRRTAKSKLPMTSLNCQVVFPSWSWMGWEGRVKCSVNDDRLESETPQMIAYTHKNNPFRIMPIREHDTTKLVTDSHGSEIDHNSEVTVDDVLKYIPSLNEEKLSHFADDYIVFFWTSSAFFTVQAPTLRGSKQLSWTEYVATKRPLLVDSKGRSVGSVCKMLDEHWSRPSSTGLQEFIVVGRRHIPEIPDFPATILALQIERVDGIAYRVNYAEIEEVAWQLANPVRILVALA